MCPRNSRPSERKEGTEKKIIILTLVSHFFSFKIFSLIHSSGKVEKPNLLGKSHFFRTKKMLQLASKCLLDLACSNNINVEDISFLILPMKRLKISKFPLLTGPRL